MRKGLRGVVVLSVSVAALAMASVADAAVVGSKPIQTWQANGTVRSELIVGNIAYLGGSFTAMLPAGSTGAGAVTRNGAAAINLDTGALLSWNPNVTGGAVYAIESSGSNIYLGGAFTTVGGVTHKRVVEIDSSGAVVTAFHPPTPNKAVRGLYLSGSNLYVGGSFTKMGATPRSFAARVNATNGALDTAWAPVVDNEVRAFAVDPNNTRVVLGGFFRTLNGQSFIGVGAVDTTTGTTDAAWAWHTTDLQTFRPFQILRFTQDGGTLFGAGTGNGGELLSFNIADGTLNYVAGTNGNVVDMAVLDGYVYFGGHFSGYCGPVPGNNFCSVQAKRDKLIALDEATGALQSWHPAANTTLGIEALASGDGSVTVGGEFTKVGGVAQQHFAQFKE